MNKPVFDQALTGESIQLDMLADDTLARGADAHAPEGTTTGVDAAPMQPALVLDTSPSELDGRRSLEAFLAAEQSSLVAATETGGAHAAASSGTQMLAAQSDPLAKDAGATSLTSTATTNPDPSAAAGDVGQTANIPYNYQFTDGDDTVDASASSGAPFGFTYLFDAMGGNDVITGSKAGDQIIGGAGRDSLNGFEGNDTIDGGTENDTLVGAVGLDNLSGGSGDDIIYGGLDDDNINGGDDNDTLVGGNGQDILDGGSGYNWIDYSLDGGNYTPVINLTSNAITVGIRGTIAAGTAWDSFSGTVNYVDTIANIQGIIGSNKGNTIYAMGRTDATFTFRGGASKDLIYGGDAGNLIDGGGGADELYGGAGQDVIYGYRYSSTVTETSADKLYGFNGDDTLEGSYNDSLWGGNGNNQLVGVGPAAPVNVTIMYDDMTSGVVVNLATGIATHGAYTDTLVNINGVVGSSQGDQLTAGGIAFDGSGSRLSGGAGNDTLYGGRGNDYLRGEADFDFIYGSAGNDTLDGGTPSAAQWGAELNYSAMSGPITADLRPQGVDGVTAYGTVTKSNGTDTVRGIWNIIGTNSKDTVYGDDRQNLLYLLGGDDTVFGGGGDDVISGDTGNDVLDGGTGKDTIYGGLGSDKIYGQNDDDTIYADDSGDLTGGKDIVDGGQGADTIYGYAGDDSLNGGSDNDRLEGGTGNDTLDGGTGADVMAGLEGDDTYYIDDPNDVVFEYGDQGTDTVYTPFSVDYSGSSFEIVYLTGALDSNVTMNWTVNKIFGNDGKNTLDGREGNDTIDGGAGDDNLVGGADNDSLIGGLGNDTLDGGTGADTMFSGTGDTGSDTYIIDDLKDQVYEDLNGTLGGSADHVIIRVANYDKRKVDLNKIEIVTFENGGSFNEAPTNPVTVNTNQYTLKIDERAIGDVAQMNATDPDSKVGPLKYALVNDFGGSFSIDPNTGIISVAKTDLDFESDGRLSGPIGGPKYITLQVYAYEDSPDPAALSSDIVNVQIEISNVNEKPNTPTIVNNTVKTVNEGSNNGSSVATLTATDPDNAAGPVQTLRWDFDPAHGGNLGGRFTIDAQGRLLGGTTQIDFESSTDPYLSAYDSQTGMRYYDVYVVAIDDGSPNLASDPTLVRVGLTDTNEAATASMTVTSSLLAGSQTNGLRIGSAIWTDPDVFTPTYQNNLFRFTNGGTTDGFFSIDSTSGVITINRATVGTDAGTYTLQVVAYDGTVVSQVASQTFTLKTAPYNIHLTSGGTATLLDENSQKNDPVGTVTASDDGTGLTYTMVDPTGHFDIDLQGNIFVKNAAGLDFESPDGNSYTVQVDVKDSENNVSTQAITIDLKDVNEAPTGLSYGVPLTVSEDAPSGATIADPSTLTVYDPDTTTANRDFVFTLVDNVGNEIGNTGMFAINGQTGELLVGQAGLPDVLVSTDYHVYIKVTDQGGSGNGLSKIQDLVVTVNPVNTPPVITAGQTSWPTNDVGTVTPFKDLTFADAEDDPMGVPVSVQIEFFGQSTGTFENLPNPNSLPVGVYFFEYVAGDHITVGGTSAGIQDLLQSLQFNPNDRPAGGGVETTTFNVYAVDSNGAQSNVVPVTVDSTATGAVNHSPVIVPDPNEVIGGPVWDNDTIHPFAHLSLVDQETNDQLTVEIAWTGADGSFTYPAWPGVTILIDDSSANLLQFQGAQADVTAFLRALEFSPEAFPNDPYQTSHPVNFTLSVTDQATASDSTVVNVDVQTQNRAPVGIGFDTTDGTVTIDDSYGIGHEVGLLRASDSNAGDTVTEFALVGDAGGLFDLVQVNGTWMIVVKDGLDFAAQGGHFTIQVAAKDSNDLWSEPQDVDIFMTDSPNHAPVISVDPNGNTTWDVKDTDFVAPFRDLTIVDVDDQASGSSVGVAVFFDASAGAFLPVEGDWSDLIIQNDAGMLTVYGSQERITAYLKQAVFNPANDQTGPSASVVFEVVAQDSAGAYARRNVTVNVEVTGNTADNAAPTITGAGTTNTTDRGMPVQPFLDKVTLADADGDDLTLTVTFQEADGTLGGLPAQYTSSRDTAAGLITYSFTGSATALVSILNAITFDATERPAPGPDIATIFTLAVNDGHHPFPVTNTGTIQVVTTVTGPSSNDTTYDVDDAMADAGWNSGEDVDPILGGFDTAIIHTSHPFVLQADDGIEMLVAAGDVTAGINVSGNNLNNTLVGSGFDDTLDGGSAGQDVLRGGLGNDTYVLSRTGVTIDEDADPAAGTDTVRLVGAWTDYTLGQGLERIDATGATGQLVLNGNGLDNEIVGNAEADILNGGGGNDTLDGGTGTDADNLLGGAGDDTYRVRHAADAITEVAGEGTDTVEVYFSEEYHLASSAHVEILKAGAGVTDVHLVGNGFSATITGSAGNDTLDGGTGVAIAHTLNGGQGNDVYYIVNAGDEIEGERNLADPADDGTLNGLDTAYLYRGLYATDADWQAAIAHYQSRGIENVVTVDGVPETSTNPAPTNVRLDDNSLAAVVFENTMGGTGRFVVADDASSLSFEMAPDTNFGIDVNTGEIFVRNTADLNFEGPTTSYKVWVRVQEQDGDQLYSAWQEIAITLDDVNEAPTGITFADKNVIAGTSGEGSIVADMTAIDPDIFSPGNQINAFRFADGQGPGKLISADGMFRIDDATGQILINKPGVLDAQTDPGLYHLAIEVYDVNGTLPATTVSHDVVIQPASANTPPTNLRLVVDNVDTGGLTVSFGEDQTDALLNLRLAADDPPLSAAIRYYMDDNPFFVIDENNGTIHLKSGAPLDFEGPSQTFTVTVRARDQNGTGLFSDDATITVTLQDRNDAPDSVAVNAGTAVKIGDLQDIVVATAVANDPDGAASGFRDNHYQFVYADGTTRSQTSEDGLFVIDPNTGEIKTAHVLGQNPTDGGDHVFTVEAFDGDGNAVTTAYTVTVGPASNSAPTDILLSANSVRELTALQGAVIGELSAVDPDQGDTFTYKIVLGDGTLVDSDGRFQISGGQLQVFDGTKFDFEQARSHDITIRVTDQAGNSYDKLMTVNVSDLLLERTTTGTSGNDRFVGGFGNDTFVGGAGDDFLNGGLGRDALTGGIGNDTFAFSKVPSAQNRDVIVDFAPGEDTIQLTASIFKLGALRGPLTDNTFCLGTDATKATQRIVYDQSTGKLYFDPTGSTIAGDKIEIATLNNKALLGLNDFHVV